VHWRWGSRRSGPHRCGSSPPLLPAPTSRGCSRQAAPAVRGGGPAAGRHRRTPGRRGRRGDPRGRSRVAKPVRRRVWLERRFATTSERRTQCRIATRSWRRRARSTLAVVARAAGLGLVPAQGQTDLGCRRSCGRGNPDAYRFSARVDGEPIHWNKCDRIGFRVYTRDAPERGIAQAREAVSRLNKASGLSFVYRAAARPSRASTTSTRATPSSSSAGRAPALAHPVRRSRGLRRGDVLVDG
jgi:hypothetical protein